MSYESYELLTPDNLSDYLKSQPHLHGSVDPLRLSVREVGDGNLNLVFICESPGMPGLCIKQSLPYVRMVGPEWPLSPERACAEARSYQVASEAAPTLVPRYFGFDARRYALALENLSGWTVLRSLLNSGVPAPGAESDAGAYSARMVFATSFMGLPSEALRRQVCSSANAELCAITEQLVLTEPFVDHPRNSFFPGLARAVEDLRRDRHYIANVQRLKHRFLTASEALVHGDLHTGSIMVRQSGDRQVGGGQGGAGTAGDRSGGGGEGDGGGPSRRDARVSPTQLPDGEGSLWAAKVFDPEFCFYGPAALDVGMLMGNLALAAGRAAVCDLGTQRSGDMLAWLLVAVERVWVSFEAELRALWPARTDTSFGDDFLEAWLLRASEDACGYAGCEIVRRIVGLAKVSDLETLDEGARVRAQSALLSAARRTTPSRLAEGGVTDEPAGVVRAFAELLRSELRQVG